MHSPPTHTCSGRQSISSRQPDWRTQRSSTQRKPSGQSPLNWQSVAGRHAFSSQMNPAPQSRSATQTTHSPASVQISSSSHGFSGPQTKGPHVRVSRSHTPPSGHPPARQPTRHAPVAAQYVSAGHAESSSQEADTSGQMPPSHSGPMMHSPSTQTAPSGQSTSGPHSWGKTSFCTQVPATHTCELGQRPSTQASP